MAHPVAALLLALALAFGAHAAEAPDVAADPALEARVNALSAELRCLVCQNQSLADSHAELAIDLKNQVREQLKSGQSEDQVIAYMTQRYGDFVLYRPPLKATTVLLWAGPLLLLAFGAARTWRSIRQAARAQPDAALSATDRQSADALLDLTPPPSAGAAPPAPARPDAPHHPA